MELLLILSAMLSAVTGAFSGERGPESGLSRAEAAVGAQIAVAAVEQQAPRAQPARPADAPPPTLISPLVDLGVEPAAPLYADRLIE